MTIGSHELALTIINDGEGYEKRCAIARHGRTSKSAGRASFTAFRWYNVANEGAIKYERQFGTPTTASCFTAADILLAAAELAEYYDTHIKKSEQTI